MLQPDHMRAGEILLETQDVVHFRAAPAIDGLVVVADAADVVVPLREQPQPEILRDVRVLILVHQDVGEPAVILLENVRVLHEKPDVFEKQIAEIDGVQLLQPLLIRRIQLDAAPVREAESGACGDFFRDEALVLPAVDQPGKLPRGPALFVEPLRLDDLLDEPDLVVHIEDGEIGREAHKLGMAAQNAHADGVERAEPGHALDGAADKLAHALFHFARGLVGEGHGQNLVRARAPRSRGCARCAWSAPASCRCLLPPEREPAHPAARRPRAARR